MTDALEFLQPSPLFIDAGNKGEPGLDLELSRHDAQCDSHLRNCVAAIAWGSTT